MRISDLSTFDSKPILLSQIDELLNNKNVTILGNSVNVVSGLVLLDDKGKIPEDADIQHIFYIDGEFPTTDIVKNSIYVSSTGEARATNNNAEYINISLKVVTDFSTVDDETVATSKAIKTYVDEAVAGAATGTSSILSSYATIEYVDNAVASASGDQHIFYVDEFPATDVAVANSLYVKKGTKEAQIFDGAAYASISLETVEDFTTVSNDTLATTQAISSFVDDKIAAIDIPDPDLSAYQPISGMTEYAKKSEIPEEVIYVDEFPASGVAGTIYVNTEGESKLWNGTEYVSMSREVVDEILSGDTNSVNVPSVKAVINYVSSNTPTLPDNITTQGNDFNTGNKLVQLVDGKIPETLYDRDVQHIFYVDAFPTSGVENSIYINSATKETQFYTGTEFISISLKVVTDLTLATNDTLATTQAISSFVDTKIAGIDIPSTDLSNYYNKTETDNKFALKTDIVSTDLSNYYNKTESDNKFALKTDITSSLNVTTVDDFPTSGTNNTMYIDSQNHAQVFVNGAWKDISLEVVEDFTTVDNITVPTTKAVKDLVDSAGGISSISVGDGLAGSGTTESPLKLNLSNYQTLDGINLSADSGLEVRALGTSIRLEGSGISIVMADPILSLSINNHLPNKSGGFAIVEEDTGKLPSSIIPSLDIQHIYKVTEFPTSGLVENSIYILESGEAKAYFAGGWVEISQEVETTIDTSATDDTIPTSKAVKDYVDANKGETIDLTNYTKESISITASGMTGDLIKLTSSETGASITFDDTGYVRILGDVQTYINVGNGVNLTSNAPSADLLRLNDKGLNQAGGLVQLGSDGKLPAVDGSLLTNLPSSAVDLTNYVSTGAINLTTAKESAITLKADAQAEGYETTFSIGSGVGPTSDLGAYLKLGSGGHFSIVDGYSFRVGSTDGQFNTISFNSNSLLFNGNEYNTANGLAVVGSDGKLPTSIVPVVDTQHIFQVESIPTSGVNNSLYVEKNSGKVQGYFDGAFQDVSLECVNVIDDSASTTTVPSTKAVKDLVDGIAAGPAMKTEAVTKDIVFKKDVSVYKIELSAATTFTFDVSNLDEANCYTFELWVQMSTAQTLTFPSNSAWLDGTTPDMSEAGMYCFVIRKMPATMVTSTITSPQILMNLAYKYSFTLA